MPNSITRTTNRLARETRGQEILEAALVLPLMFMILLGIFWFGQAFRIYGTLTHAAREGARAGVAPACSTCASQDATQSAQNAYNAVKTALLAARLDPGQLQMPATTPSLCSCGSSNSSCSSSATCDPTVALKNVCVQENVQLSYSSLNGAGTCGTSVSFRYKYPYHFYLPCAPQPCTALDLRNLTLPAQAEMRIETQ
jgi:Flp pilus assembly protein TadG